MAYHLSCSSDAFLTRVATEQRTSLIRAWEESEKAKAENRQSSFSCLHLTNAFAVSMDHV